MRLVDLHGFNAFMPCSCCGMTYTGNSTKRNTSDKGIHVIYGKQGKELVKKDSKCNRQTTIKHVKTRNGDLTVVTRSEYVVG